MVAGVIAFNATAGAFTFTVMLLLSVAMQGTLLVLTVAVATTVYIVVSLGLTVMEAVFQVSWVRLLLQA